MKTKFIIAFQITRKIVFEIGISERCKGVPYFHTSACQFNQPKTDYNHCGQAQKELLKGHPIAMNFYNKFDQYHLKELTEVQYNEIIKGIEKLKTIYNFAEADQNDFGFSTIKELSKLPIKK